MCRQPCKAHPPLRRCHYRCGGSEVHGMLQDVKPEAGQRLAASQAGVGAAVVLDAAGGGSAATRWATARLYARLKHACPLLQHPRRHVSVLHGPKPAGHAARQTRQDSGVLLPCRVACWPRLLGPGPCRACMPQGARSQGRIKQAPQEAARRQPLQLQLCPVHCGCWPARCRPCTPCHTCC